MVGIIFKCGEFIDKGEIKLVDVPENLNANYGKKNLEDVFLQLVEDAEGEAP